MSPGDLEISGKFEALLQGELELDASFPLGEGVGPGPASSPSGNPGGAPEFKKKLILLVTLQHLWKLS